MAENLVEIGKVGLDDFLIALVQQRASQAGWRERQEAAAGLAHGLGTPNDARLVQAMLSVLYKAAGNPVLVSMIQTLWQHCRAYKIVGAQGSLDAAGDDSLWRYQQELITAARGNDVDAAASVNAASLLDASDRIKARLAAQAEG